MNHSSVKPKTLSIVYCLTLLFKVWQSSGSCCGWLYCLTLLFKVWQRSGSCSCCYIVHHYCLRFDKGVVHVVVILTTITVLCLTEEWFMLLLLYWLALLFKVWQRSGSCFCCCYIGQYSQPQHEPLLYHTLNSNCTQYSNNNMNHSSVKP
jgi:hypothetical protein